MDPISTFFSVFTFGRVLNTLLLGAILGRVFNPSNAEIYKLAMYLFLFLLLGIVPSFINGQEDAFIRGLAGLALWGISNIGLLLGRMSVKLIDRGHDVLERKRSK